MPPAGQTLPCTKNNFRATHAREKVNPWLGSLLEAFEDPWSSVKKTYTIYCMLLVCFLLRLLRANYRGSGPVGMHRRAQAHLRSSCVG